LYNRFAVKRNGWVAVFPGCAEAATLGVRRVRCDESRRCETCVWRRLYARKQSKSIGRRQTVESLRCQRAALGSSASLRAITRVNVGQAPKALLRKLTHRLDGEGRCRRSRGQPGFVGSAGVMTMARDKGNRHATREIRDGGRAGRPTGNPRGTGRAIVEVGEVHSTNEAG